MGSLLGVSGALAAVLLSGCVDAGKNRSLHIRLRIRWGCQLD